MASKYLWWKGSTWRRGSGALLLCFAATAGAQESVADTPSAMQEAGPASLLDQAFDFQVAAQKVSTAILDIARQANVQALMTGNVLDHYQAQGLHERLTLAAALDRVLSGTPYTYRQTGSNAIMVGLPDAFPGVQDDPKASAVPAQQIVGTAAETEAASAATDAIRAARRDGIEEIIVTGQKREERIQDVPIAISAFSMDSLDSQKIEGGFDLLKAVPNVTFSKTNFTGYNFQIRGIGTQAISATTDPGVAVSFNNTTLIVNRLFEQEYLDIERVEVLRGPQGTLFGRNATAGVINVISAKPEMGVVGGEVKLEAGNYNAQRFRGHLNLPIGETLATRLAFSTTRRDGYGTNLASGQSFIGREAPDSRLLDNRNLWTGRVSLAWEPSDRLRANLVYERFEEDDARLRSAKQLCHRDEGDTLLGESLFDIRPDLSEVNARNIRGQLSQGCKAESLFDKGDPNDPLVNGAFGIPQSDSIPFVRGLRTQTDFVSPAMSAIDMFAGRGVQSSDLRTIFSPITPEYRARSELYDLGVEYDLVDGLTLSTQVLYMENDMFSTQDFLRFETRGGAFLDSRTLPAPGAGSPAFRKALTPGGIYVDPQLGPSDRILMQDVSQQASRQMSAEVRLSSSFSGPTNFSLGANYTTFANDADYFVFSNALSLLAQGAQRAMTGVPVVMPDGRIWLPSGGLTSGMSIGCGNYFDPSTIRYDAVGNPISASCVYVQHDSLEDTTTNPEGHNFFLSRNPFSLKSAGLFGELYVDMTETVKLTAGLRMNWDRKSFTPVPSQTLLPDWRGRFEAGFLGGGINPSTGIGLPIPQSIFHCDPSIRTVDVIERLFCGSAGNAPNGRGYPALPDIVQEWRVPTGRLGVDWKPMPIWAWLDESMLYAFLTRGYKAGGANPPGVAAPQGLLLAAAQGAEAPRMFEPEYVNALEIGTKNKLFGGAITLNATAFYYDYQGYQVSKIVDRSAANENFDATVWGLELEAMFAPSPDVLFNATLGYLRTRIADGEQSLDLMDRTQGGNQIYRTTKPNPAYNPALIPGVDFDPGLNTPDQQFLAYDQWVVVKPNVLQASNCVAPAALVRQTIATQSASGDSLARFCPAGQLLDSWLAPSYEPLLGDGPNGGAGFLADIGGHELPNAPRFTVALGAQRTVWLPVEDWSATARVDWYLQEKSWHRVYNTEFDRLRSWSNTNVSVSVNNDRLALTVELYVKNLFDETPVTGAFLNSDDTGLTTNVFTLDPRLVGLSLRKRF